ncbi:MAG: response regulator [Candidatus Omnitrophota bacterium]
MLNTGKKVLVIDDEHIICRAFEKELGEHGYQVDSAYDADQALEMINKNEYDLVFIDLVLPGKDGIQTCQAIKAMNKSATMIFMTGNTDKDPIFKEMEFVDAGGRTYQLYKPFLEGELLEIAQKALNE